MTAPAAPSNFANEMTHAFAQYGITFTDAPPLGINHRVNGMTADEYTAVEIVVSPQRRIVSGSLVGVMAPEAAQRNRRLAQHLVMALIPEWKDGPAILAEAMHLLRVGGTFTTEQYGSRLTLTYLPQGAMLTMKVEVV